MIKFERGKIIEINRKTEKVTIPPTTTRICEAACFFGSITSLNLENTLITIIEKYAFANCYSLIGVAFPSCLEEICEGAFKQCRNLKNISFPPDSKLLKIGDYAFESCNNIETIDLRNTRVCYIGTGELYSEKATICFPPTVEASNAIDCSICNHIVIESHPVIKTDEYGYFNANGVIFGGMYRTGKHVLIRRGVERIAKNCFYHSSLVSVTIPSSVTEISESAFSCCESLRLVDFPKDSRLKIIKRCAFNSTPLEKIQFPKSLKIIKKRAFNRCESLELVVFPQDSQLERIEEAFRYTAIKSLSFPPSVREIVDVSSAMNQLKEMFISNDVYQSNEDGSVIYSKDGSELVSVINTLRWFIIPDRVRVIKKRVFYCNIYQEKITIPPSVEIIEENVFKLSSFRSVDFPIGSKLKSLAFNAFSRLEYLIINNMNFSTMRNGVVMSLNPRGIVFVPRGLTQLLIPPGIEVIYHHAFYRSSISSLKFPKSLKRICPHAFYSSFLELIEFEQGTELNFIGNYAFSYSKIKSLKLPPINGELEPNSLNFQPDVIHFSPKLILKNKEIRIRAAKIAFPRSILSTLFHFRFDEGTKLVFEGDH